MHSKDILAAVPPLHQGLIELPKAELNLLDLVITDGKASLYVGERYCCVSGCENSNYFSSTNTLRTAIL
ncbi:uncharacterized protein N7473_009757 [Penicillium subrubescens]|uniref:uncharacterized protein n=1 Tax=Penicillium subrubescens TaxID=1316194 RepID=UPI002544ECB0|nr:uncharacterized protein N7473_009757 [Penicillium subrubescens]KAJ5882871.1 hypothetical protein N7473_009757 [Penicillium subrubescens]